MLGDAEDNEAYLAAKVGEAYLIFFADGGEVSLGLSGNENRFTLQLADINNPGWSEKTELQLPE